MRRRGRRGGQNGEMVVAELTTPARQPCGCRATPPLQGGECKLYVTDRGNHH